MAGKGGGSWKVAYADFVTAMMAFFLVMWIGSQDQKIRQSVSNYFVDPSGASKKPAKTGATFDSLTYGSVPKSQAAQLGRGRDSHSSPQENSPATKAVSDWLAGDKKALEYWQTQANRQHDAATRSREVKDGSLSVEKVAIAQLSKQLHDEIIGGIAAQAKGLYQDLLFSAFADVNWNELAEDLLRR